MDQTITSQGRLADAKLAAQNLVLTTGGEPTFVPQDASAPEWNIAALGAEKLVYARKLARKLASSQFQGGVILQSFGKQYPNEPLPRWQIGIYRYRSGRPLWTDLSRLRLDQEAVAPTNPEKPREFIAQLANRLSVQNTSVPAYEDIEAGLKRAGSDEALRLLPRFNRKNRSFESRPLPKDVDKVLASYLNPAGWVLPLGHDGKQWETASWCLEDGDDVTLIPGDSPIGLRLPLSRLPQDTLKSGLTVQVEEEELLIFLPPLPSFSAFADLVGIIEELATSLDLPPVRLEGYRPPGDEDVEHIALTSDPGVLEVNLPPAARWDELEDTIRGLFSCAEAIGMRGHKFQMSGRTVSTGGGAHIILGGPSLDENPFIKRPTLLSSLLRFLQHHPSLSYAFSGLFIGPSSQAPRVDESAFELPYELEIALQELERMSAPGTAGTIDGILRNLLMDWNGNTHRAELSVDKFFNADAPNGKCGLIEFRAFEMAPSPDMLLAANVLLRALTACFAEEPFKEPLIDWREALHDKFALPFFLRDDLRKVIAYLNARGFDFQERMFDAQLDFRFPVVTEFSTGNTRWTLRQALELWPVMGDHQGTGRIVDSTTDRLELRAEGFANGATPVAGVNGIRLPLVKVGESTAVCGIRYRLFDNPWGLQPHIHAHSPLKFIIMKPSGTHLEHAVDYWNWKDCGDYEKHPATREEADQRVAERVQARSVSSEESVELRDVETSPHAPFTLDLRRC